MNVVAGVMLVLGFGFVLSGVIGILRFPDFYCRLHAMGKCDTLGVALMIGGLAASEGFTLTSLKMLLVLVFISLANPTAIACSTFCILDSKSSFRLACSKQPSQSRILLSFSLISC